MQRRNTRRGAQPDLCGWVEIFYWGEGELGFCHLGGGGEASLIVEVGGGLEVGGRHRGVFD